MQVGFYVPGQHHRQVFCLKAFHYGFGFYSTLSGFRNMHQCIKQRTCCDDSETCCHKYIV